jgi:hypothetical protein
VRRDSLQEGWSEFSPRKTAGCEAGTKIEVLEFLKGASKDRFLIKSEAPLAAVTVPAGTRVFNLNKAPGTPVLLAKNLYETFPGFFSLVNHAP